MLKPYDVEQAEAVEPLTSDAMSKKSSKPKKSKVKKLFVLDTNVLMHDPASLFRFEEHDLYLPMGTLEELDSNKKGLSDVARNARQASRFLDEIVSQGGDIEKGFSLKAKMKFPFELLSDADEELCTQFGVMKMKNMYGKKVRGIERSTFVLDGEGVLAREWRGVKVPGHAEEVLSFVKTL